MQIVDGVKDRIYGFGLGDEADHAGVEVEIGEQHLLVLAAEFGGDVSDQGGGAASAFGREESEGFTAGLGAAIAAAAALHGTLFEGALERLQDGREQIFVDAGPQGGEDGLGIRRGIQGDDHGIADGVADGGDQPFERLFPVADVDEYDVGPHAFEAVHKVADVADILMFNNDAERKIREAGLGLLQQVAIFDCQPDG